MKRGEETGGENGIALELKPMDSRLIEDVEIITDPKTPRTFANEIFNIEEISPDSLAYKFFSNLFDSLQQFNPSIQQPGEVFSTYFYDSFSSNHLLRAIIPTILRTEFVYSLSSFPPPLSSLSRLLPSSFPSLPLFHLSSLLLSSLILSFTLFLPHFLPNPHCSSFSFPFRVLTFSSLFPPSPSLPPPLLPSLIPPPPSPFPSFPLPSSPPHVLFLSSLFYV